MGDDALGTYLQDHLAGSQAALELLGRLAGRFADTDQGRFFHALRSDVQRDQEELKALLDRLDVASGSLKQAVGWAAEKLSRMKLGMREGDRDPLALFEALELLALGILGKRALWRALRQIAPEQAALAALDLPDLERRAEAQYEAVEARRLDAAREALRPA